MAEQSEQAEKRRQGMVAQVLGTGPQDSGVDPDQVRREGARANEDAVVQALFGAAKTVPTGTMRLERIHVPREDQPGETEPFSYRVRAIKQAEYDAARSAVTKRVRDTEVPGYQFREQTDGAALAARLVYLATLREDKERYWDNLALQAAYNVGTGRDLVGALHYAGELARAAQMVLDLSGFAGEAGQREQVRD